MSVTRAPDVAVVGGGPAGSMAPRCWPTPGCASSSSSASASRATTSASRCSRRRCRSSTRSARTPRIEAHGFLRKPGGTFQWGRQREPWSFWFREDPGGRPYAFQVIRAEFDQLLLENARDHGAEVHEEHAVEEIDTSGPTPVLRGGRRGRRGVRAHAALPDRRQRPARAARPRARAAALQRVLQEPGHLRLLARRRAAAGRAAQPHPVRRLRATAGSGTSRCTTAR